MSERTHATHSQSVERPPDGANRLADHRQANAVAGSDAATVVLVGNPNVGKSALFGALTGRYAAVSNYPGTTVAITSGNIPDAGDRPIVDTPGTYSLAAHSDDERVTRDLLLSLDRRVVIAVLSAGNIRRGMLLALELAESGVPFILALNMADEAERRGWRVDVDRFSSIMGVPVVSTVATRRVGLQDLLEELRNARPSNFAVAYDRPIEEAIKGIGRLLPETTVRRRFLSLLVLSGADDVLDRLGVSEEVKSEVGRIADQLERELGEPVGYAINRRRLEVAGEMAERLLERVTFQSADSPLGRWTTHPILGWPILVAVLYALYVFVGKFGAGTLVDFLEGRVFGGVVNPWVMGVVKGALGDGWLSDLLVGEYGLVTMGLTYALAIVLPIVGTFFLVFGVLEDSGYLPRIAVMLDRAFGRVGLNGRAVLPMILGLGCTTMATLTTRVLDTVKERIQVTLLLALGIPCSAQLGVVLGMLGGLGPQAFVIWLGIVLGSLLAVGYLSARLIPGEPAPLIMEIPPLRAPILRNVVVKTLNHLEWYLKEIIPLFALGSLILFFLDRLGGLVRIEQALAPFVVGWLGLPIQGTAAFLIGFIRRDYGAAEFFSLANAGLMDPVQTLVSLVVITLFMPCIANLFVIIKERGIKVALGIAAFVLPFAFVVGGILNLALRHFNVPLG